MQEDTQSQANDEVQSAAVVQPLATDEVEEQVSGPMENGFADSGDDEEEDENAPEHPMMDAAEANRQQTIISNPVHDEAIKAISEKVQASENILVALSNNPSVDDIAAALGLAMALDKMGKHATAIYSGETPNVLEFLEPGKTLEPNTDSLQDLVIALNKDKADHLRYKVDGEFVKIYITPYRTKLSPDDLSYSYGNYNVDLVIALNVPAASSLDAVLREHGRIMHDASAVDITVGAPGRFGEIEWSNPAMSSVSEMVTNLLFGMDAELDGTIATALLAGIVGATERFKNERTMSETMKVAAKLMESGANAQLVAENVDGETAAEIEVPPMPASQPEPEPEPVPEPPKSVDAPVLNEEVMEELRRQQEEANKPVEEEKPVDDGRPDYGKMIDEALAEVNGVVPAEPSLEAPASPVMAEMAAGQGGEEPVMRQKVELAPSSDFVAENAVAETPTTDADVAASGANLYPAAEEMTAPTALPEMPAVVAEALADTGELISQPEPVIEPAMPMPEDGILPPPPTPEVNFDAGMPEMPAVPEVSEVAAPVAEPVAPVAPESPVAESVAPASPEAPVVTAAPEAVNPASSDPSEFKIPGM